MPTPPVHKGQLVLETQQKGVADGVGRGSIRKGGLDNPLCISVYGSLNGWIPQTSGI